MKKQPFLIHLLLTLLLISSTNSFAFNTLNPVQGWYFDLVGGVSIAPNVNATLSNDSVHKREHDLHHPSYDSEITYLIGGNGGGGFGYRIGKFRVEGEVLFNETKYKQIKIGGFTLSNTADSEKLRMSGYTYFIGGLINGFYEFYQYGSDATNFVPYVGLGIGYASINNKLNLYENDQLLGVNTSSGSAGIGQAILGLSYFVDDFLAVSVDYRYMITTKAAELNTNYQAQTVNIGFTYALGR